MDGIYHLEHHDFTVDNKLKPLPQDQGKHHLVLTFAYWCPNCHGMRAEFKKLHKQFPGVRFYAVNGTGKRGEAHEISRDSEQQLMKRWKSIVQPFQFRGFPSMYLFGKDGKVVAEFQGPRTVDGIRQFLQTQIKDLKA
jgi:thiol-disulfide isomerase/thioredoxin